MKVTENFHVEELVHPNYVDEHGVEKCKFVLEKYAPFMLEGLEQLKTFIGGNSVIINDYKWGGNYESSGLRHPDAEVGAGLSAHYFMLATDCKIKNWDLVQLQEQILENRNYHPYIVRMEDAHHTKSSHGKLGRDWLHIQWGYRLPNQSIEVFKP